MNESELVQIHENKIVMLEFLVIDSVTSVMLWMGICIYQYQYTYLCLRVYKHKKKRNKHKAFSYTDVGPHSLTCSYCYSYAYIPVYLHGKTILAALTKMMPAKLNFKPCFYDGILIKFYICFTNITMLV
jgi:hypothetical protein